VRYILVVFAVLLTIPAIYYLAVYLWVLIGNSGHPLDQESGALLNALIGFAVFFTASGILLWIYILKRYRKT
jgi:hypothetical protein